jgi:tetratricopeptide (TPR) repeat protein
MRVFLLAISLFLPTLEALPCWAGEANKNAVALLAVKDAKGQTFSTGSGFVVDPDGTLVTNYHVLIGAHSVTAVFPNGITADVARVKKIDRVKDFAILELVKGVYSTLELGDSDPLKPFDYTTALGYLSESVSNESAVPQGELIQTYGFVLGVHLQASPDFPYIYTTTPFGPGFSGGPLLDHDNRVIGLATVEGRALNLALPVNQFKVFVGKSPAMSFKKFRATDKNSKEALYYKGNFALYGDGDPDTAQTHFQSVLKKDPRFVLAYYDLAGVYRDKGEAEKAIATYRKALKINPRFPEALANLGGQLFRAGRAEEAVTHFQTALRLFPNFVQALSNLGAVLNKLNKPGEAVTHLEKAVALDPEFGVAHFNLGNALLALNRLEEAEKNYVQAVEFGVDFVSLHWRLYEIYKKQNREKEMENQLNLILGVDPDNADALQKLGERARPRQP